MQAITIDHDRAAPALGSDVRSAAPAAGEVLVRVGMNTEARARGKRTLKGILILTECLH